MGAVKLEQAYWLLTTPWDKDANENKMSVHGTDCMTMTLTVGVTKHSEESECTVYSNNMCCLTNNN